MANGVQGAKSGNMGRVIIIMGSLIIVALVGVIVALVLNLNRGEPEAVAQEGPREQRTVLINDQNVDEIIDEMLEEPPVQPGYYQVSMNMDWTFPNGRSPSSDAYVENAASNTNDIYFDVSMRDSGETIYESPVIPLGSYITGENIVLNRNLPAGTYSCVITYHLIDENQNTLSTVNLGLTVIVES